MQPLRIIETIRSRVSVLLRRSAYLAYYAKDIDLQQLKQYQTWVETNYGRSRMLQIFDMLGSVYRYNVSFVDYYNFEFFRKPKAERETYAGTGFMYEYQLKKNPRDARPQLEDKILFLASTSKWVHRKWARVTDLEALAQVIAKSDSMIVVKNSTEQAGRGVRVIENMSNPLQLSEFMKKNGFDLAEEYVVQHPAISALAPGSLNTLRIITEMDGDKVRFLGVRLRLGAGANIDNFSQGGLVCSVDVESGEVTSDGYSLDFRNAPYQKHPISGQMIKGFLIPGWPHVRRQVELIAQYFSTCKSVGWDIAVTSDGIELIEGNHNWGCNSWQIPEQQGLRVLIAEPRKVDFNEGE